MTQSVVIVGGGAAGWLTAGILATKLAPSSDSGSGVNILLLESPDVANLGVGEGTWPTMRDTLRKIGISEVEFLKCCDASFKQASQFIGWQRGENESYYHPFSPPAAYANINLAAHWQSSPQELSFTDTVCAQGRVCELGLAPKLPQTPEYAFSLNYGYHLNAGKFVQLLQRHCVEKLGVEYKQGHVQEVVPADNGDIAELSLVSGEKVAGELFVDCTGFSALLIGKHYGIPFVSQRDCLFNDTALALQAEYAEEDSPIASCTKATAQSSGWVWDIALPSRRGIGHVYSSQHTSAEKAEADLERYLASDPDLAKSQPSPRKIQFKPGYRQSFWHKNCVAIGVSAGFVEPLEATALVLIEKSAEWLSQQFPQDRASMTVLAKRFNALTLERWGTIIDFLKLHYVLTERTDSDYWRDHCRSETIPESLQESLTLWKTQVPWLYESNSKVELFSAASIQYVLCGMGFKSSVDPKVYRGWIKDAEIASRLMRDNQNISEKLMVSLPKNRALLDRVRSK